MPKYKYLIVGGGMTADAALRGIRELDSVGTVGLVGAEPHPPYNRPPLSKALWQGKGVDMIWRHTEGAALHTGCRAVKLDLAQKKLWDDKGRVYSFEKLLLATGGSARRFPFGNDAIIYFRTLDDYTRLRALSEKSQHFAVIGGGFIGSEIAAALAQNGKQVTLLFPETGIGARLFPPDLAQFLVGFYREKGVEVHPGETVTGLERQGEGYQLGLQSGGRLRAQGVVAGIGIQPNTVLADQVGLKVDNGIVVDEYGLTSQPGVFAAGDVANFYNPALGLRIRVEHEDHANTHGLTVGHNMAGAQEAYHHLPFFYSDLFELGYEAVGMLDPRLETYSDWKEPYREGVVYYLDKGRVRGVLLWNTWGQVDNARALIAEPGLFRPADLKGRL